MGLTLRRSLRLLLPAAMLALAFALPAATSAKPDPGGGGGGAPAKEKPDKPDKPGKPDNPNGPPADDGHAPGGGPHEPKNDKPAGVQTEQPAGGPAEQPTDPADPPVDPEVDALVENGKVDPVLAAVAVQVAGVDAAAPLRVLVFGDDVSSATATVGAAVRRELGAVTSVSVPAGAIGELADQQGVRFVMLDVPVRPTAEPDSVFAFAANFPLLDAAPFAWSRGRTGRGVGVAVLDSGIGAETAFAGRLVHVDLGRAPAGDAHGHGTFVAGVLAGETPDGAYTGIAPGARVFDVNISQPDGVYSSDVIAGLEWVLANHRRLNIRVVNLSLAETLPSSYRTNPLDATIERLWRAGVVVVVAAGNLGAGTAVYAPANDPYVITVGALDQGSTFDRFDDVAASFSATGPTLDGFTKPDLLAPGRRIVSLLSPATTLGRQAPAQNVVAPGLAFMTGTSFAAPQVAGAAAILLQQHPRWTPDEVKWVLTRTARRVSGSSVGTLDLRRAVTFRGWPGSSNRALRPARGGGLTPDDGDYTSNTWSSNTWSSNTWSSNTWSSNTWSSNTWSSNTWSLALQDWFTP